MEIKDRWCAAYALATGCTLVRAISNNGWTTWQFDDTEGKASRALGEWRDGTALVPARQFARAWRELRNTQ